jgi:hypothetical protein
MLRENAWHAFRGCGRGNRRFGVFLLLVCDQLVYDLLDAYLKSGRMLMQLQDEINRWFLVLHRRKMRYSAGTYGIFLRTVHSLWNRNPYEKTPAFSFYLCRNLCWVVRRVGASTTTRGRNPKDLDGKRATPTHF